jgi:beta-lactamase class A
MMNLQQKLEAVTVDVPSTFGVAVQHLRTGESASINETRLFQMASTFKVPILAALFRDVEAGKLTLDKRVRIDEEHYVPGSGVLQELDFGIEVTIRDLATLMIILSDNVATDLVLELVGTDNVADYMKQLGFEHTFIHYSCWDLICLSLGMELQPHSLEAVDKFRAMTFDADSFDADSIVFQEDPRNNAATAADLNRLMAMIFNYELQSGEACEAMLEIMCKQQHRSRIPYLLPEGTKVANKTGTISDVINDIGIVYLPEDKGAFAISVLSKGNPSLQTGESAIALLARTAFDHFMNDGAFR